MDLFFLRDVLQRGLERKKTLIFLAILFVAFTVLGLCFVSRPAVYEYHLSLCDKFVTDVCFSDTNVLLIFLMRLMGHVLLLLLILVGGLHPLAILIPLAVLLYRAFTFGGSLYVFFTYYGFSGGMIVFVLYLPIHLAVDFVLIIATTLSLARAFSACDRGNFVQMGLDALAFVCYLAIVLAAEMLLLLALFHPIGNIL